MPKLQKNTRVIAQAINGPKMVYQIDGAPGLNHLKSTGALEEDSRAVLLLHRAEELGGGVQALELNLAKNTYGGLRTMELRFDAARCTFQEIHDIPN